MTSESRDTAWLWCSLNSKNRLSRADLHHCISCLRGLERKRCISAFHVRLYQFFCFLRHRHHFCPRCGWIHAFVFQLVFAAVFFGCAFTHSACKELFMNIQCMLSGLHGFSRHLLQYCLLLTVTAVGSNLSSCSCLPFSWYCTPFMVHSCQRVQAQLWRHVLVFNF